MTSTRAEDQAKGGAAAPKDNAEARLSTVLERVPELAHAHRITPLTDGITNRNYRIDTDRGAFVVRIGGESAEELGIDRAREHACSRVAEAAGVGPEVVAFLPDE